MTPMASQIIGVSIVYSTLKIKENIKVSRHWPLSRELTSDRKFPAQRAGNTENVSIWWLFLEQQQQQQNKDRLVLLYDHKSFIAFILCMPVAHKYA